MIDDLLRPVSKGEKISSSPSVKKSLPIVDVASKVFLKSSGKRLAFSSRFSAVVVALEKPRSLEVSFFRRAELDTSRYYGAEESITFRALCFEKTSTLFPTKTALCMYTPNVKNTIRSHIVVFRPSFESNDSSARNGHLAFAAEL